MKLLSKRLSFKEFAEEDFEQFYSVFSNGQVMRYTFMDKFDSDDACRCIFNTVLQNNQAGKKRTGYEFAVFSSQDGNFVGIADIDIHIINESGGCGEIGYYLLPEFWGNGYATEIADTLIRFCFSGLNLHRVEARCNSNNTRSENVMVKTGMVREGVLREVRPKGGQWDNEALYSILKEEWEKKRAEPAQSME